MALAATQEFGFSLRGNQMSVRARRFVRGKLIQSTNLQDDPSPALVA
jgi:hypothetical protein